MDAESYKPSDNYNSLLPVFPWRMGAAILNDTTGI